jgi:mannose-6-phosphate isomerase-like protein (cupin superfamily)
MTTPSIDDLLKPTAPEPKTWGVTWPVIETDLYARYALEAIVGGYSSLHYHAERANRFRVLSGAIIVWRVFGTLVVSSEPLTDGQTFDVPSLVVHGFGVLENAKIIEEYWPDRGGTVRRNDIQRLCHGGRVDVDEVDLRTLPRQLLENPL